VPVPDLRERWRTGWLEATIYDSVIEREHLAALLGRLVWGIDAGAFYGELARLGDEPDGTAILDVPCGGGVAFRGLRPEQHLRYVAADLSPAMLERARAEAKRRNIDWIEFTEADVEALPFEDGTFDLCVTYTGLHCFPDPARAVAEMARVLCPGGELRGTAVLTGAGLRQDAAVRMMRLAGLFGPSGTLAELKSWLTQAGLAEVSAQRDGALAYFSRRRDNGA
jgi:ubiquinone/menaquinone biosynthesis C-methylase UbiE